MRANHKNRRGVTLLELLIVVGIMLLITSIAVTAFVPSLASRRIRETARQIDIFLSSARNRALATGREAGVVFRAEPNTSMAFTLQVVESPEPYAGDDYRSRVWFYEPYYDNNGNGAYDTGEPYVDVDGDSTWDDGLTASGDPENTIYAIGFYNGTNFIEDTSWQPIIQPGDTIRFNYQGASYLIMPNELFVDANGNGVWDTGETWTERNGDGVHNDNRELPLTTDHNGNKRYDPAEPFIDSNNNGTWDTGEVFADDNQNGVWDAEDVYPDSNSDGIYTPCPLPWYLSWDSATTPAPAYKANLPFQIQRQPVASAAGSLQLPEGVAIDLWASGVGSTLDTLRSVTGADVYRNEAGNIQYDASYGTRNIAVLFNSKGDVVRVYDGSRFIRPLTGLHFLIGQSVKGGVKVGTNYEQGDPAGDAGNGEKYTWQDQDSLWITIHPTSGLITTTENVVNSDLFSTTTGSTARPIGVATGRGIAATAQGMGGR